MYYIFDMNSLPHKNRELYKMEEVKNVVLKAFDRLEDVEYFMENDKIDDPDHCWWPVHDVRSASWIPVVCADEEDARRHILETENETIFMTLHDL